MWTRGNLIMSKSKDVGYRYNGLYGDVDDELPNYIDAHNVIKYEIFELGNLDILDTLRIKFGSSLNSKLHSNIIKIMSDMTFGIDSLNPDKIVSDIISMSNKFYHTNINYVIWLCDSISDIYSSYDIPKKKVLEYHEYAKSNVILSDLGKQGKLYGYESIPFPNRPIMITRE